MHPRSNLFHGKFRLGNVCPQSKHAFRPFSSDETQLPTVAELISKQLWKQLKSHLPNGGPATLLQQLLDSKTDPYLTLRYFKWSQKEFNLSHSLESRCKLLHSLANAKRYSKMRSFLYDFAKYENSVSVSSVFHAISICGDSFSATSLIADMLVKAYLYTMKTHLGFEAFKRAGDYGYKLSVLSCNHLLSALVKENEIENVEYVFKEMIRRKIEVDVTTFNIVINGLCTVGKLNKARLEEMKVSHIRANSSECFLHFGNGFPEETSSAFPLHRRCYHSQHHRQLVGEEASSQSGKFTLLNCFDMGSGSVACAVKEGVKLYFYNIRAAHVDRARDLAIEAALEDALSQGLSAKEAAKQAQIEGKKAAKLATRQAKRIIGPIISSGWDFFEAIYYGGTLAEGFLRGAGTLVGAYSGGFLGEQRLGRVGYLVGSHLGSWVGGRIGLMVYDVVNGVHFLLQFAQMEGNENNDTPVYEESEVPPYESESSESQESPSFW
ncbi:hypothetical protein COLO4_05553 [Corchorus olitorius]|uniref:Pentatricopeptide repeat-containing protein n=1 Tax=Corchorus olitorius TaxID=93759 RepID=A0A1R3KQQ1_9ROSI|nr:hypothetical protein COLO4_05553 [Corchorus olitorius]